jgi:hypothetical protein
MIGESKRKFLAFRATIAISLFSLIVLGAFGQVSDADDTKPAKAKEPAPSLASMPNLFITESQQYLIRVNEARGLETKYAKSEQLNSMYLQLRGTLYSYVGMYREALTDFDHAQRSKPTTADPNALQEMEARDALATVLELAGQRQVIMINEAHHVPLHRTFTTQLLDGLYRKGYRYFAAETLASTDPKLEERGYPNLKTGYYSAEPMYGELIRTALRLGYHVVPYEAENSRAPNQTDDPAKAQNDREEGQAQNLKKRILDKDPKAKIIVHAGYAHITKKPTTWNFGAKSGEVRLMACRFKALTGIDPLTVDQTLMTERGDPSLDNAFLKTAIERGLVKDRPIVLRDHNTKEYFVPKSYQGSYDLVVFHPRSKYENGRPTWLAIGGARHSTALSGIERLPKGKRYLAQAFYPNEEMKTAVPADQIVYTADSVPPTLWLPKGEMHIRIIDESGNSVLEMNK